MTVEPAAEEAEQRRPRSPLPRATRVLTTGRYGATIWFRGPSPGAQAVIASATERELARRGISAYVLDGDREPGVEGSSLAHVAAILADAGVVALAVEAPGGDTQAARELHRRRGLPFLEACAETAPDEAQAPELRLRSRTVRGAVTQVVTALDELGLAGRPAAGGADAQQELTLREREILALIELGLTNKEIARRLSIRLATVKNHVHHILDKVNASRRGQAVAVVRAQVTPLSSARRAST